MPLYEYDCPDGHRTEKIRSFVARNDPLVCHCGAETLRVEISHTHCAPDGVYSYAPNLGSEAAFERKRHAIREGIRVYPKESH
jgi:putative FmdB family regulatory protein